MGHVFKCASQMAPEDNFDAYVLFTLVNKWLGIKHCITCFLFKFVFSVPSASLQTEVLVK